MKCQDCVHKISEALRHAGYKDAVVTLNPPQVEFAGSYKLTAQELQIIVSQAGKYTVAGNSTTTSVPAKTDSSEEERLIPLLVILAYIIGGVLLRAYFTNNFSIDSLMSNFMGGFFVTFSLFKLLDLPGFAEAYGTYDILAARSKVYAYSYPFIELLLGLAFFIGFQPMLINFVTLVLMVIGSVGVFQALRDKRSIQCACLGTVMKLPMTKVTLVEDVVMGIMAGVMVVGEMTN